MPNSVKDIREEFPSKVSVSGDEEVELRLASTKDRDGINAFAQQLPEEDLLFLRVDITKPEVVDNWLDNLESGQTVSIVAYSGDAVVGYATVDRNAARWTRRMGELRVNVAPAWRSRGLGRQLTAKIFDVARGLGLRKLIANMTPDQRGARSAFRRLGFVAEALLADAVEDRNGGLHDLVIMSYDVDGLNDQVAQPLRV